MCVLRICRKLPLPLGEGRGEGLATKPKILLSPFLSRRTGKRMEESFLFLFSATPSPHPSPKGRGRLSTSCHTVKKSLALLETWWIMQRIEINTRRSEMKTIKSLSRRKFARLLGAGAAYAVAQRGVSLGMPSRAADAHWVSKSVPAGVVRLSANENRYGPSPMAFKAMTDAFSIS